MKRSHMTGGLLIQSPYNEIERNKVYDFSTFSKFNEITRCTPCFIEYVHVQAKVTKNKKRSYVLH